jgi:hypothetical protein
MNVFCSAALGLAHSLAWPLSADVVCAKPRDMVRLHLLEQADHVHEARAHAGLNLFVS